MEQNTPLLKLPPELRNRIYRFALVNEDPIVVKAKREVELPELLSCCRQIRSEAQSIYFGENSFHLRYDLFDRRTADIRSLRSIGSKNCELIKCLSIEADVSRLSGSHEDDGEAYLQSQLDRELGEPLLWPRIAGNLMRRLTKAEVNLKAVIPVGEEDLISLPDVYRVLFKRAAERALRELIAE